jgi:hypothetical protein
MDTETQNNSAKIHTAQHMSSFLPYFYTATYKNLVMVYTAATTTSVQKFSYTSKSTWNKRKKRTSLQAQYATK